MASIKTDFVLTNLCVTLLVLSQYLTLILECYLSEQSGYFTVVIGTTILVFLLKCLFFPIRTVSKRFLCYSAFILLSYLLTLLFCADKTNLTIIDYLVFCFIPFTFSCVLDFDCKTILKWSMYAVILAFPVFSDVFAKGNAGSSYDAVSMGSSYALLPVVGAALVHFMFFRREATFFDKIVYVLNLIFLLSFIQMSYRGPLMCVFLILGVSICHNMMIEENAKKKILLICIVLFLFVFFMMFYEIIINVFFNLLEKNGIRIAFIDKNRFLTSTGDGGLFHGRLQIWKEAWDGFLDSPIWGHGLSTFLYYTGTLFPHNFVLQLLYDGGLLLAIPLFYLIFEGIKKVILIRKTHPDYFSFAIFAGGISFPRGLVSAETWRIIMLWVIIGYLCNANLYKVAKGK